MPSLKDLKARIKTVKSSQKITKAMKMVAASKLRKAKDAIENSRPYTEKLNQLLQIVATEVNDHKKFPIIFGREQPHKAMIIAVSSDRGLCGAFNNNIAKATKALLNKLRSEGVSANIVCVGKKSYEILSSHHSNVENFEHVSSAPTLEDAINLSSELMNKFRSLEVDKCYLVYNEFISAVSQNTVEMQLIPFDVSQFQTDEDDKESKDGDLAKNHMHIFEPEQNQMVEKLITDAVTSNIFRAMLENAASENGARMTAMDNASRNAGEMIKKLNVQYNRTRQAAITTELIEIISGAEALK